MAARIDTCALGLNKFFTLPFRENRESVINLPTTALTDTVLRVGNTTGAEIDKFDHFGLTAQKADRVMAPLIVECHADFECRLADDALVHKYNFFIFEVLKAHVAKSREHPETRYYKGDGVFMVLGKIISRRSHLWPASRFCGEPSCPRAADEAVLLLMGDIMLPLGSRCSLVLV
jgi:flavin reductase (DIM6/NTAB) family NADH-FMN oxidoreductase RutF